MIELRWTKRPAAMRDGPIFFQDESTPPEDGWVRVLQYRYRYPLGTMDVRQYPPREWIWSEWQDVPA